MQHIAFFSLRCSARERFWLETASQTWRTKSFNRFQGPLTVERITTGQVRILKEGFQYKAICFFCVRFKESEGLEQANWRRNANTLSGKTNFLCIYILASRRNPNSDKCKEEIARMLILWLVKSLLEKTWNLLASWPRDISEWIQPGWKP